MNNMKVPNVPGGGLSALLKVSIFGGLAVYGAAMGILCLSILIYLCFAIEMFVMCFATCSTCSILKGYSMEVFCYEFSGLMVD
ncbi:hypothetical protein HN873_032201 [Arachis hypogaea]